MEALLRKHEEVESELTVIEKKLEALAKEASRLSSQQQQSASKIGVKQAEIIEQWELLIQQADERKTKLEDSRKLQQFLSTLRDVVRMCEVLCNPTIFSCVGYLTYSLFQILVYDSKFLQHISITYVDDVVEAHATTAKTCF